MAAFKVVIADSPTADHDVEEAAFAVSGLAITSLVLALVGSFTIVGSLAAIGAGYLALRQIGRAPDRIGG